MKFEDGAISIEGKDNDGEVIGHALSLGQALSEVAHEQGIEMPRTREEIAAFTLAFVVTGPTDLSRPTFERFKTAEIDTAPRKLEVDDLSAVLRGLAIMSAYTTIPFKPRMRFANIAGQNGRAAVLDYGQDAVKYKTKILKAIKDGSLDTPQEWTANLNN